MSPSSNKQAKPIQPPKGTRDLYPDDLLKRRYIQNAWRDASLRCGFDEIEGPTFESSDLYSIKSGEGILSELFQTFSGKGGQETLDKLVAKGKADFALRPEFTPTLARMYAARAKQLNKPCKWFTAGPYFRAERPQRGRLREFLQWNCDIIGGDADNVEETTLYDVEVIETCRILLDQLGLLEEVLIDINHRSSIEQSLLKSVKEEMVPVCLSILDASPKIKPEVTKSMLLETGMDEISLQLWTERLYGSQATAIAIDKMFDESNADKFSGLDYLDVNYLTQMNKAMNYSAMGSVGIGFRPSIVRGLAYYTGTVFEAIADGERAVAGGGRYDNLIELMGGPPTPAVGFAMGDVVLGNLLDDKQLMPEGADLMEAVSRKQTSIRPEAFIAVPNNDEENKSAAQSLTAALRRGQESETYLARDDRKPWQADRYTIPPLHTRTSYKSTTNPGKLRKDAEKQHAKFFVEIHAPNKVELTDMDNRESITSPTHGSFSVDPKAENYIATALAELV